MSDTTEPDPRDALTTYDLHAWKAPPPAPGLADRVLRRMQGAPPSVPKRRSWRTVGAAAGATLVAAVATIALATTSGGAHGGAPEVARAAPAPVASPPAQAGGIDDPQAEARIRGLEARMERLEHDLDVLRAQQRRSDLVPPPPPRAPAIAPVAPAPPIAPAPPTAPDIDGALDPYRNPRGIDPFASRSGVLYPPPPPPPVVPPPPVAPEAPRTDLIDPFDRHTFDVSPTGELDVTSQPVAHIAIDGADSHQQTPCQLTLTAGRHKVTFQIGGDRYSYNVTIIAGQTLRLVKDLLPQ